MEDFLRNAIESAVTLGLELVQRQGRLLPRKNGCRPGDVFDPRLMTAEGIRAGSAEESKLVKAGGRVAMVLSPPFLLMYYKHGTSPTWDVETVEVNSAPRGDMLLSDLIIRKGNVLCYTMTGVEISGMGKEL